VCPCFNAAHVAANCQRAGTADPHARPPCLRLRRQWSRGGDHASRTRALDECGCRARRACRWSTWDDTCGRRTGDDASAAGGTPHRVCPAVHREGAASKVACWDAGGARALSVASRTGPVALELLPGTRRDSLHWARGTPQVSRCIPRVRGCVLRSAPEERGARQCGFHSVRTESSPWLFDVATQPRSRGSGASRCCTRQCDESSRRGRRPQSRRRRAPGCSGTAYAGRSLVELAPRPDRRHIPAAHVLFSPPTSFASPSALFSYASRDCYLSTPWRPYANVELTPTLMEMMANGPHDPEARVKPRQGLPRITAGLLAEPQSKHRAGRVPGQALTAPTRARRTRVQERIVSPRAREEPSRDLMRRLPPVFPIAALV